VATKAAQVDELWDQPAKQPGSAAYMQANGVLQAYSAPKRQVRSAEPVTLNVLGVDFNWTHDGREFPAGVLAAIERLYAINGLPEGWDSYGGKKLAPAVVAPVLGLVFLGHRRGNCPRLTPLASGGVGLRWEAPENEIDVDVTPDGGFEITIENLGLGECTEHTASTLGEAERIIEAAL
jgi:hypothetical protein